MNIALSTLVIILGLIPGIVFLNSYYAGRFPRQLASLSPLGELALYFLWAIPIDAVALCLWHPHFQLQEVRALSLLLQGHLDDASRLMWPMSSSRAGVLAFQKGVPGAAATIYTPFVGGMWWECVKAYLLLVVGAMGAGVFFRRLVWTLRLDISPWTVGLLLLRSEWYYRIMGRSQGIPRRIVPRADVMVAHEKGSRLYSGLVTHVRANKQGEIEEIVLAAAERWRYAKDKDAMIIVPIKGDVLVIRGENIENINVVYGHVKSLPKWSWRWWLHGLYTRIRSFVFEEP